MMTDAPERIWGWVENLDAYMPTVLYRKEPCPGYDLLYGPFTEYLRADLRDRNAILEEAAKVAEGYAESMADACISGEPANARQRESMEATATHLAAAIRAMKEAK